MTFLYIFNWYLRKTPQISVPKDLSVLVHTYYKGSLNEYGLYPPLARDEIILLLLFYRDGDDIK